ncbi:hypothetical protein H5410_061000 [Solanum commersonii]|uniref:Uncharacterized protein n=1 Tax=Solanum commersonii TaxID=4109 RepID=A0A9J5W6S2_SOLCO|nr:hypothetical protein H5410_061000 [Solanum commersonii]
MADRRVDRRSPLTASNDPLQHIFLKTRNTRWELILSSKFGDGFEELEDSKVVVELNEIVVVNMISHLCFWLARERGRKIKTTKLMAERVNPSPSPTHSARESEWAKVEDVIHAATRCSRETELIRGKLLQREFTLTIV